MSNSTSVKLDWSRRLELLDQNIVLHKKNTGSRPRVTIGMPTYRRSDTIRRALMSVAAQTYRQFVLVVSDNNGRDAETIAAIKEYAASIPEIIVIAQKQNIGAIQNLSFLLAVSSTEYFMWLADDDEISPDYLEELVGILDSQQTAVAAMGRWKSMTAPDVGEVRPQLRPDDANLAARVFRYVAGNADDSAFYGLHRTARLRQFSFGGYLPPNQRVLTNWCYLLLFDLVLQGRIAYAEEATWICHNYSVKHYAHARARSVSDRVATLLRRVNVYAIYTSKTARRAPFLLPVVLVAAVIGLCRDIVSAVGRILRRRFLVVGRI